MASRSKRLRTGYTTGACAAAAAKAGALLLLGRWGGPDSAVEIPFPGGARHRLPIRGVWRDEEGNVAWASIVKDAGDDPDVTNNVEIRARVAFVDTTGGGRAGGKGDRVSIKGGCGVGLVTRPGLSVEVGGPAINPVPRRMIDEAVREAFGTPGETGEAAPFAVEVTICVPEGETVAKKTLNSRLGIVGGISILGTTGIVRPISSEAWTATISASMSVAKAAGREEIVLSSGRSSERAHMSRFGLPEESYVMMGDYVEYALREAGAGGFRRVHLVAQWAKMLKIAMAVPQTHVRHGAIDVGRTTGFLEGLGFPAFPERKFNTVREIFDTLSAFPSDEAGAFPSDEAGAPSSDGAGGPSTGPFRPLLTRVCAEAEAYAESLAGIPVLAHLVSYQGEIIAEHG